MMDDGDKDLNRKTVGTFGVFFSKIIYPFFFFFFFFLFIFHHHHHAWWMVEWRSFPLVETSGRFCSPRTLIRLRTLIRIQVFST